MEYEFYIKQDSDEYYWKNNLPDTTVWAKDLAFNDSYVDHYYRYPGFRYFPVVGVNWRQAINYCKWRTRVVNIKLAEDAGLSVSTGSNMILNKNAWIKVNGYDEQYLTNGEDIHFCIKLRNNGFRISYDNEACCYHLQNDNLETLLNRCWRYYINGTGLKKPSYKRMTLRSIKHFKYCLINTFKDLINLRFNIVDINFRVLFNYIKMEYKSCKAGKIVF